MNAKHLTKNAMSRKLVFLAVGIALAIIAAFSICATTQAKADDINNSNTKFFIKGTGNYWIIGEFPKIEGTYNNTELFSFVTEVLQTDEYQLDKLYPPTLTVSHSKEMKLTKLVFKLLNRTTKKGIAVTFQAAAVGDMYSWNCFDIENWDITKEEAQSFEIMDFTKNYTFYAPGVNPGINISGRVLDAQNNMPVPFANVVYCQYNPWWDMYLPVEGVEPVKTDMWGFYTLEGITEEMLPGKVFVYDGIKQIGESVPIWFFPEDMETLYMWPIVVNQEQPDPPVPPTPPDPPVPPGPVPPEPVPPVPPVPPTPVPTPDNPGGGIAQTSDNTGNAFVIFVLVALLGAGVLTGRKLYNR